MSSNKTVSLPLWGYDAMVALRTKLKVHGASVLPRALRAFAAERMNEDGEAFSRGFVLALAAWGLNELAQQSLTDTKNSEADDAEPPGQVGVVAPKVFDPGEPARVARCEAEDDQAPEPAPRPTRFAAHPPEAPARAHRAATLATTDRADAAVATHAATFDHSDQPDAHPATRLGARSTPRRRR